MTIANTTVPLDIYVSAGYLSDPNKFEYDAMFSSSTSTLKLNSNSIPIMNGSTGFAISIYVQGLDSKMNTVLSNSFAVSLSYPSSQAEEKAFIQ